MKIAKGIFCFPFLTRQADSKVHMEKETKTD